MLTRTNPIQVTAFLIALFISTGVLARDEEDGGDGHHGHSAALIRARQKFFGVENVNRQTGQVRRDRVIFSWVTNTTYAVSVQREGLLDGFLYQPSGDQAWQDTAGDPGCG